MDHALIINGVVNTVYRDANPEKLPEPPAGGQWVEAAPGEVFAEFEYDGTSFFPPPADVAEIRDRVTRDLMGEWRFRDDVSEATAVGGGTSRVWAADQYSLLRIVTFTAAINAGLNVPNPMPWFPKGSTTPVNCTRQEMGGIAMAIINRSDAVFRVRISHEANIIALADAGDVEGLRGYDVTTGWA